MSEDRIVLKARFSVPKAKIKNANVSLSHIVSAQKSSWIREYAVGVWDEAVKESFGLVAIEPQESDWKTVEMNDDVKEVLERISEIDEEIVKTKKLLDIHNSKINDYREDKKNLRKLTKGKASDEVLREIEYRITEYDETTLALKAKIKRLKATVASTKKLQEKAVSKELRRIKNAETNLYHKKKLELNEDLQIFKNCAVIVRVHNITNRDFDSPNFYPSVKPILDAATDCGVIWPDDNNRVISGGMLFLSGKNLDRDNYIFDIEISSTWPWEE